MLQATSFTTDSPVSSGMTLVERVRDAIDTLSAWGGSDADLWARGSGPHVLIGLEGQEAFARLTPLGAGSYGLAFRAMEALPSHKNAWEPLLLVDELAAVVEHALVAVEALSVQ